MGHACCSCHDKTTTQLVATFPDHQPTFRDNSDLNLSTCPQVIGDYVMIRADGSVVDVVHINISSGASRWIGLGSSGCGVLHWNGRTMNLAGSDYFWQYQANGDFFDQRVNYVLRDVTAYWMQFKPNEHESTTEAPRSVSLDDDRFFDSNPYVTLEGPLYAALASGNVRLVRGCFLMNCWEKRRPWPMRQDIPESGFWPADDACRMWRMYGPVFFFALSYAWLHPTRNDPGMWYLERVARIVDEFRASSIARFIWFRAKGIVDSTASCPPQDIGFFIDFCSLPQQDVAIGILRSKEEHEQFVAGLGVADVIYAHAATTVIRITSVPLGEPRTYSLRGWTSFEETVSSAKPGYHFRVFTFDDTFSPCTSTSCSIGMLTDYMKGQLPPQTPQQFQSELQRRRFALQQSHLKLELFANPEDEAFVLSKYSEVWACVSTCESLSYQSVVWGKAEAFQLASVLTEFSRLKVLALTKSAIGFEGLLTIFGSLPATIEELTITHSAGGDAANVIAKELPRLKSLRYLDLGYCNFGDDGIEIMAHRMPRSLQYLELPKCGFKERGAVAIAQLLSHLLNLFIPWNDLSGKGTVAFVRALSCSPIKRLIIAHTNLSYEEKERFRSAWGAAQKQKDSLILFG